MDNPICLSIKALLRKARGFPSLLSITFNLIAHASVYITKVFVISDKSKSKASLKAFFNISICSFILSKTIFPRQICEWFAYDTKFSNELSKIACQTKKTPICYDYIPKYYIWCSPYIHLDFFAYNWLVWRVFKTCFKWCIWCSK